MRGKNIACPGCNRTLWVDDKGSVQGTAFAVPRHLEPHLALLGARTPPLTM